MEKICEQTTFCPTDVVRHTVVGSAGVALDLVHGMIWNEANSSRGEVGIYNGSQNLFQSYLILP
jgi:hypothetical protein